MAFNERLARKLAKLLVKVGLNEDKAAEIVDEVAVELAEEGSPEVNDPVPPEGDPIPPIPPEEEPSGDPIPPEPGPAPIEEEPEPEGEPVPPLPPEGAIPQEPTPELPPEVPQPPIPTIDPSIVEGLKGELEEQKKANEGLLARVDSLEQALKAAGILEGTPQSVGVESNPTLPDAPNGQGAILDEVLKQINNNGH